MAIPTKKLPNSSSASGRELIKEKAGQFPLARKNFIFMIAAGLLIVIGFLLMLGSGTTPEKFNPEIFSARRIIVGPTLAFLGFVSMGVAIIIKPGKKSDAGNGETGAQTNGVSEQ